VRFNARNKLKINAVASATIENNAKFQSSLTRRQMFFAPHRALKRTAKLKPPLTR
jgi:hypothetical protein